jgi:hypothetical protein
MTTNLINYHLGQKRLVFSTCINERSQDIGKLLGSYTRIFACVPQINMRLNQQGNLQTTSIFIAFILIHVNDLSRRATSVGNHWCVFSDDKNDLLVKMSAP